ncbi:MAG: hypothetical protein QY326_04240 [Bdellovibrionota bacterium]|nr:MAG: hypothetical protein QY326_04240 [Bdellovibrionota bacterium]
MHSHPSTPPPTKRKQQSYQMLVDAVEDVLQVGRLTLRAHGTFRDLTVTLTYDNSLNLGVWMLSSYRHGIEQIHSPQGPIEVEYLRGRASFTFRRRSLLGRALFARKVKVEYDLGLVGNCPTLRIVEPSGERHYPFARRDWR